LQIIVIKPNPSSETVPLGKAKGAKERIINSMGYRVARSSKRDWGREWGRGEGA
jgi:hypothetical protein